jgi:hypothetical protein
VTDKGRIDPGQMVNWVLPGAGLRLLPNAQGTTTSTDCTAVLAVDATVQSVRHLGDVWLVKLRDNSLQALFQLQLTGAEWQQLQVGQRVVLQMDRRAIHIMPTRPAQALWPHPQR